MKQTGSGLGDEGNAPKPQTQSRSNVFPKDVWRYLLSFLDTMSVESRKIVVTSKELSAVMASLKINRYDSYCYKAYRGNDFLCIHHHDNQSDRLDVWNSKNQFVKKEIHLLRLEGIDSLSVFQSELVGVDRQGQAFCISLTSNSLDVQIIKDNVDKCYVGYNFKIVKLHDGCYFGKGENTLGQLGVGHNSPVADWELLELPENTVDIKCSFDSSVAITREGKLCSWGANHLGELGRNVGTYDATPGMIGGLLEDRCVKRIYYSCNYAMAITNDNRVFSWGGFSSGHAGYVLNVRLGREGDVRNPGEIVSLRNKVISKELFGSSACFICDDENQWWCWGENKSGELGQGHNNPILSPTRLDLDGHHIKDIISGGVGSQKYTFVLSDKGQVFACGNNNRGSLGTDHKYVDTLFEFKPVNGVSNAVAIDTNRSTHFAVDQEGKAYGWGANHGGRTCIATECKYICTPEPMPIGTVGSCQDVKFTEVTANQTHDTASTFRK